MTEKAWVVGRPEDKPNTRNCWLRGRFHKWDWIQYRWGQHQFKCCTRCNAKRVTRHVSCSVYCWGGPV